MISMRGGPDRHVISNQLVDLAQHLDAVKGTYASWRVASKS